MPLLKAKNRNDEARRVCETIISQYRDSILANEAMRELISLPKPATAPVAMPAPTHGAHPDGPPTGDRRTLAAPLLRNHKRHSEHSFLGIPQRNQYAALQKAYRSLGRTAGVQEHCRSSGHAVARLRRMTRRNYRFENWKRLRAPGWPDFFRSFIRGSRLSNPSAFKVPRRFASTCKSAREIASRAAPA